LKFYDYIIIGQGLAGSLLSYHFYLKKKSALVIDQPDPFSASQQAAGLYSPVTGKNLVFTWKVHQLFQYLIKTYTDLEQLLDQKFLHGLQIYKPFLNNQEFNDWMGKDTIPATSYFVENILPSGRLNSMVIDPYGGLLLKNSGYLDVPELLHSYRKFLTRRELLLEDYVEPGNIYFRKDYVQYKKIKAGKIILCTGNSSLNQYYFPELQIWPLRGEIVEVEFTEPPQNIISRGIFMLPKSRNLTRIGATYERGVTEISCQLQVRKQFDERIRKLYRSEFVLKGQIVGVRPTTMDRRPLLGFHPRLKLLGIFNGLGTKGVSLAPFFANEMVNYLEEATEIAIETDINRYF